MESEEWRECFGYRVSNYGRVESIRFPWRCLKPDTDKDGYDKIRLQDRTKMYIHRLVALAFIPNHENKQTVDHINKNKKDNRVENLRWATPQEQTQNRTSRLSVTGYKHIGIRGGKFRVFTKGFDKTYKTIEEAIRARDEFLK